MLREFFGDDTHTHTYCVKTRVLEVTESFKQEFVIGLTTFAVMPEYLKCLGMACKLNRNIAASRCMDPRFLLQSTVPEGIFRHLRNLDVLNRWAELNSSCV